MKKEIIKEYDGRLLILDIMLYCIIATAGFILLNLSNVEMLDPVKYAPSLLFVFGFFSLLVYFANRKRGDYELLIFGFINVCVASFILFYTSYPDSGFILADAVLIYSIANVINKGYSCKNLIGKKDINFFPKVSITILLLILGVLVVSSIYNKVEVGSLILGYYFIIFGLLSLLEPLVMILTKNVKVENFILDFLSYNEDEVVEEDEEIKPKEVKKEKIESNKKTTSKSSAKSVSSKTTSTKTIRKPKQIKSKTIKK